MHGCACLLFFAFGRKLRRRLFHTPPRKKKKKDEDDEDDDSQDRKGIKRGRDDSSSEDGDLFRDKYKLEKKNKSGPQPEATKIPSEDEVSEGDSKDNGGHEEEEESRDDDDPDDKPFPLKDDEPKAAESKDPVVSGYTQEQKLQMLDANLVALLTKSCAK